MRINVRWVDETIFLLQGWGDVWGGLDPPTAVTDAVAAYANQVVPAGVGRLSGHTICVEVQKIIRQVDTLWPTAVEDAA